MSLTLERHFTAEPLSPVLGASIVGLDLREPLPEPTSRAVYDAASLGPPPVGHSTGDS